MYFEILYLNSVKELFFIICIYKKFRMFYTNTELLKQLDRNNQGGT